MEVVQLKLRALTLWADVRVLVSQVIREMDILVEVSQLTELRFAYRVLIIS